MNLKDLIIEENEHFIAINKPQGLVVNRSETQKEETLQDLVENYLVDNKITGYKDNRQNKEPQLASYPDISVSKEIQGEFQVRSGIVHRLDKDTSGVVLVAKTPQAFAELKNLFLNRKIKKSYYAVVFGDVTSVFQGYPYLKVDLPLARNPRNRMKYAVVEGGREAVSYVYIANPNQIFHFADSPFEDKDKKITGYKDIKRSKDKRYKYSLSSYPDISSSNNSVTEYDGYKFSFLRIKPKTGRTHQIRVHLKALNHEILGDRIYEGRKQKEFSQKHNISLMLHARSLRFSAFGQKYNISAAFPKEFVNAVKELWDG